MPDINSLSSANSNDNIDDLPWERMTRAQRRERNRQNEAARQAYDDLASKPIEPGFVLVMMLLEFLARNNRHKFRILHDWLVEKLGRTYHSVHIASGYATDQDEGEEGFDETRPFYKAREEYIEALNVRLLI